VISSQALRRLAERAEGRVVIDQEGEPLAVEGLPEDAPVPGLVVGKVNEAVKQVEDEMIVRYLNRDAVWAVEGFLLDTEILSSLPDGVASAAGLIEAMTGAGYEWHAVIPIPPEPLL
jgi:hypothetical protein